MTRTVIISLSIIIALFLIFEISEMITGAQAAQQSEPDLREVLKNQELILKKLESIENKLDVIKMRIRQ